MKNYKIIIQYDGTRYKGWQVQKSTDMTIQGKLQAVLEQLVQYPVEVIGSGRTDAGVHAIGQVANFHLKEGFSNEEILEYLNQYLPMDIAVTDIEEVEERFHSRYHATSKTYVYRIHTSTIPNVFERKYMYTYTETLDIEKMKEAAAYLIGTHDFLAFCGNKKMKKSTVRTITDITIEKSDSELQLSFTGDGFLQNMIRIITGTLIEVGSGRKSPYEVREILEKKDRTLAGYTAPSEGLILKRVKYEATMDVNK
ncbi:MAG: tRNA pseudouridine(38-40) synthase TruA [Lachnospiraceae bacterium]|nr:tRNA pseudouridine(38-40) synthase TruA [Lachnospiraceae bacterium]